MSKIAGIYIIKNIVNNKVYIGQSSALPQRFQEHRYKLRRNIHGNSHLQNAWNKYGENKFVFILIEKINNSLFLTAYEQSYVNYYKTLNSGVYNMGECTENPNRNRYFSQETRQKLSKLARKFWSCDINREKRRRNNLTRSVERINKETGEVKEYFSLKEAERDGFRYQHIWRCCNGIKKSHKGYFWKYLIENKDTFEEIV